MKIQSYYFVALLLSSPAMAADCDTVTKREGATLKSCGKLSVLTLEGKPLDRAKAFGQLMRPDGPLSPDIVNYFSDKVMDAATRESPLISGLFSLAYNQIVRLMHRRAPAALSEELDALASGMGLEGIDLRRAVSLADTGALLNAIGSFGPLRSLPSAGCTSIAIKDAWGNFVYGRNLDFAGAEVWDKHPLITVILPEPGSAELKHIAFGADGVLFGGITGVNEAGISFAVHQNYSRDATLSGVPMMFVGELVLRQARSLDEAEAILRRNRPAFLWTFVLTDLKTGNAMAVETSQRYFSVRRIESRGLVQTNHVMDDQIQEIEFISTGTKMNSIYRMKKAFESIDKMGESKATPELLLKTLSQQESPKGELSAYRDVLKAHTIQTILLESEKGKPIKVFVSQDMAPTSGGSFAAFSLADLFQSPDNPLRFENFDPLQIPAAKRSRQREISQAFHAYFDQKDIPKAMALLSEHQTLDADLFRSVALYQQGLYQEAHLSADTARTNPRNLGEPAYILQSLQWVKLASLHRLGRERAGEAKSLAARVLDEGPVNPRLEELAKALASGKTPHPSLTTLTFEFFSGDIGGRER